MTAKTTAERQRAYRARKAAAQLIEVRGIFAPREKHSGIRLAVKKMTVVHLKKKRVEI